MSVYTEHLPALGQSQLPPGSSAATVCAHPHPARHHCPHSGAGGNAGSGQGTQRYTAHRRQDRSTEQGADGDPKGCQADPGPGRASLVGMELNHHLHCSGSSLHLLGTSSVPGPVLSTFHGSTYSVLPTAAIIPFHN